MQSFAIRAPAAGGFRLTVDLSAWAAVGISLAPAIIRVQARADGAALSAPPALEFVTNGPNPVTFDPLTNLMVFAAPASATANLLGVYRIAARAEFSGYETPLFGGNINFVANVFNGSSSAGVPLGDTAWISAHPFGPAPAPASISTAVTSAQDAARQALSRAFMYGG